MIGKILSFIVIIGGLVGVYFIYQEQWGKVRESRNPWVEQITPLLRLHSQKNTEPLDESVVEANFLRLLHKTWLAAEENYGAGETLRKAAVAAGLSEGDSGKIAAVVQENLQIARAFDVFTDPNNEIELARGSPPLIRSKGWEDEKLVMGRLISPLLAPEAAYKLANLRLMPESARDLQSDRITGHIVELAKKWQTDGTIQQQSYKDIMDKAKDAGIGK